VRHHRDHSADAGGDQEVLIAKRDLREEIWAALQEAGAARFPGARGRIPNFTGAEAAAERLRTTEEWRAAATVKANPDSPQWPVRQRALADGMLLYMAVPRLAEPDPFLVLDPTAVDVSPRTATSIKGAGSHGRPTRLDRMEPVDLVVTGCVAVDRTGARLGKGGGFADLEFAVASAAGLITDRTIVATTVHPLQVVADGRIPLTAHDVPVDLVVTPEEIIRCPRPGSRPAAVRWEELTEKKVATIPVLQRLRVAGAS
jgi:5-formyltetrahydrofolate cyclo-ligase